MSKFKALDYANYNRMLGFDRYKQLYELLEELFTLLPFEEDNFNDDTSFEYDGMICYIDKQFGSVCEIKGTDRLKIQERIKLHQDKVKTYKKNIIQLKLF